MRFKQYILDILEEAAVDVEAMHYAAAAACRSSA